MRRGLKNDGENNCFINSVIQVLFNDSNIRKFVLEVLVCTSAQENCFICALKDVFVFMSFGDQNVSTNLVRLGLQGISSNPLVFQKGNRGCVIEMIDLVLAYFHLSFEHDGHEMCLSHNFFSYKVEETGECLCCEGVKISEESYCLKMYGLELLNAFKLFSFEASPNIVMHSVICSNLKRSGLCTCGERVNLKRKISLPSVFAVALIWDMNNMKGSKKLFKPLNKNIDLSEIFEAESPNYSNYSLTSMICYSKLAKHYISVIKSSSGWSVQSDEYSINSSWSILKFGLKLVGLTPIIIKMGSCFNLKKPKKPKNPLKSQEELISEFERASPFARISLNKIEKAFKEFQFEKRLAMPDLRSSLSQLGLDFKLLNVPESPFCKYFDALLEEDRLYFQRKLVLSAVLASTESVEKKLLMVTKYYDLNEDKEISKEEIETFIDDVIDISVKVVPMMAVKDALEENSILLDRKDLDANKPGLEKARKKYKKKLVKKILNKKQNLNYCEFIQAFERKRVRRLLSSRSVRAGLHKRVMKTNGSFDCVD